MEVWLAATFWGGVAGSALLLSAAVGYYCPLKERTVGGGMAFGAGVLITTLSFELMDEAHKAGGLWASASGFLLGALVYIGANQALARAGPSIESVLEASSRKRVEAVWP